MAQVSEALGRGHALFGVPLLAGGIPAKGSDQGLATAGELALAARARMASQSGAWATRYSAFATEAGPALHAARTADDGLGETLYAAADADRAGRRSSGSVLDGAVADTAALAPSSGTARGQRAIVNALRARVAQQRRLIAVARIRDAQLASVLRSLSYGGGAAIPADGLPSGPPMVGDRRAEMASPPAALAAKWDPGSSLIKGLQTRGRPVGTPLGAFTRDSGRREVASAIVHEALRRGYSPQQTVAILADAIQESNLNPRARSPNGLWESIFQQDASYPGRHDPNLVIAEFFNRLDRHGGPASSNIWHSIFWLQQRPGDPSAAHALAWGRRAYLGEIMARQSEAAAMFRDITAT
jgi:hypothetical protein